MTKKDKNYGTIIAFIVIGVILVALAGYFIAKMTMTPKNPNIIQYKNITFEKRSDNKWYLETMIRNQPYLIPFYNMPNDVENVTIDDSSVFQSLRFYMKYNPGGKIYITVDPNASSYLVVGGVEFARLLGTGYNIYNMNVSSAITKEVEGVTTVPVITCSLLGVMK